MKVVNLGLTHYVSVWNAMREFTDTRNPEDDQLWITQHHAVFTQGTRSEPIAGKIQDIPVVKSDRGGLITYHGPGQLVIYFLLNIKRLGMGPRELVATLEQTLIDYIGEYSIQAHIREGAPGVYISDKKVAALGLRIRKGCTYHGISINVDMDLTPFTYIDPCGYEDMEVTQLRDWGIAVNVEKAAEGLVTRFRSRFFSD